ncbi:MAG: site-2 protease family protein [Nitrososphaerales archaeon]
MKIHATFILALLWGAFIWGGGQASGLAYGAFLTLALFAIVLAHEFGHAIAAQRYGVKVQDIVLLPIGGVARLNRMPDKPSQELVVALAGPAVNLAMALLLAPLLVLGMLVEMRAGSSFALPAIARPGLLNLAAFLVVINISLLVFNMVPAFPMDGGRVLRALLALKLPYGRATGIAANVGRLFALGFGLFAILTGNFSLALVAMFVFFGAGAELQDVNQRESLRGLMVSEVVDSHAPVFPASLPAFTAFERLVRSPYPAVAVVDDAGRFIGVVTRQGMQARWAMGLRGTADAFVEAAPPVHVECDAPLATAREQMAEARSPVAAVYCGNSFEGLLDFETISRIVAMRQMGWTGKRGPVASEG